MAVLEHPADVVRYVLEHVYGETDPTAYEPLSWAETRTEQAAAGLVWAVRYLPTAFTEFCALVARQSNADLYQSAGLWVYRWRTRRPSAATFTVTRNVTAPLTFSRRPVRTALAARLGVSWDLEHAGGNFRSSEVYTSALASRLEPAQLGRRVTTDEPIDLPLPYVVAPTTARYLGRTALTRVEQQRWTVELQTDWDALPLEKGDTILVESPLLVASLGTSLGTFLVTGKRYDPASDAIVIQAEEAPTALLARTLTFAIHARPLGATRALTFAVRPVLERGLSFALSTGLGPGTVTRALTFAVDLDSEPGSATVFLTFAIGPPLAPDTITRPLTFAVGPRLLTRPLTWAVGVPPRFIIAEPGAEAVTGAPAALRRPVRRLAATPGASASTGVAAALSVAGGPPAVPPTLGTLATWGNTGSPPFSKSFTTGVGHTYLLVWLHYMPGVTVSSVAFGATSLTLRAHLTSTQGSFDCWSGVVPASTTANVVVNSGDQYFAGAIASYVGVTAIGTPKSLATPSAASSTLTFDETLAHARYVDAIGTAGADANPAMGAGQATEIATFLYQGIQLDGSAQTGTPSVTWTGLTHGTAAALHIGLPLIGTA